MPKQLEITYRATGGRQPVDLDLHLQPDGHAELFVGSSYSIPLARISRAGAFGGQAPAADVDALRSYLAEHDLLSRSGSYGQATPDSPARSLTITADGRQATLALSGMTTDADIDGFEQLLQRLALALTNQPMRAVEASLDLRRNADQLAATIGMRSVGSQPLTVLLIDPSQPNAILRAQVELAGKMALPSGASMPLPMGNVMLSPEAVQELVKAGKLPSGVTTLPVDASYRLELPPLKLPQATVPVSATGTLQLWLVDGQARRRLTLLTPETPLP